MIPRVVHRVWIGPPMPPEFEEFHAEWEQLNPGWEVRLWGEEDIDDLGLVNRDLYDAAAEWTTERLVPRFRSNLVRYELLHRFGGVYVDCDLKPLRPLPDLAGVDCFAGWERDGEWVGNSILGSTPDHPFLERLIAGAAQSCRDNRGRPSPQSTGPQYLTRVWRADPGGLHLFPERVFYPRPWRDLGRGAVDLGDAVTDHLWAALRGQVSVVISHRPDGGERDRNLAWVLDHYRSHHPSYQVVVQDDPAPEEPFNKGFLSNLGVAASCGDVLVVADGDLFVDPDSLDRATATVHRDGGWVVPYSSVRRLDESATVSVLAGERPNDAMPLDRPSYAGIAGGGLWVMRRSDFLALGGMDPRFAGWGREDEAFGVAADTLVARHRRLPGPLWHLWHPPADKQHPGIGENDRLMHRYRGARGNPAAMRAVISDQPAPPEWRWWRRGGDGRVRRIPGDARSNAAFVAHPEWEEIDEPVSA